MTWVNLNDVYVKKTGGTINGDLDVTGAITVNDGSGNGTKYDVANEISTLRDSVSQATVKTNWAYLYQSSTFGKIMYRKYNNIVFVFIGVSGVNKTWACENKLPSGFRPPVGTYIPLAVRQSNACAMAWIGEDGLIQIYNYGGSTGVDFLTNYTSYTIN